MFTVAFAMLKPFLSEVTLNKVSIHGYSGWKEKLLSYIDPIQIPKQWGGTKDINSHDDRVQFSKVNIINNLI